jgi:hypothetical protein
VVVVVVVVVTVVVMLILTATMGKVVKVMVAGVEMIAVARVMSKLTEDPQLRLP